MKIAADIIKKMRTESFAKGNKGWGKNGFEK